MGSGELNGGEFICLGEENEHSLGVGLCWTRKQECLLRYKPLSACVNLGITAKQVAMVWACVPKRGQWLAEGMYGVWSGESSGTWIEQGGYHGS